MSLFFLMLILLVPTVVGLTIAITGVRGDMRLRRSTRYRQRGPEFSS